MNWREFQPTIYFLLRFIGLYLSANLIYGLMVTAYYPAPDPITVHVTKQTVFFLSLVGEHCTAYPFSDNPTVAIVHHEKSVVSVYEGCNGINVMIIFIAFLVSFGQRIKNIMPFALAGITIIHIANLIRIALLFEVALVMPQYLYFSHKYLFTASLYAIVMVLWLVWINKHLKRKPS